MRYFKLHCLDKNHPYKPYIKQLIWSDDYPGDGGSWWLKIELNDDVLNHASELKERIMEDIPRWYVQKIQKFGYSSEYYIVEEVSKTEAFLEVL